MEEADGFITSFWGLSVFRESIASFTDIRNLLVESFDDDDFSEDEFLFLYDANTSKHPDLPYDCYDNTVLDFLKAMPVQLIQKEVYYPVDLVL